MNKTFKRVLASMLAILMIVCSMPFTVFAAEQNRKWWIEDGIDPATISAEPVFWGFNSPEDAEKQPYGPWGLSFGSKVDFNADAYEDHRDDFKPLFAVTVSDVGTKGDATANLLAKYQNNYAASAARTFEAAMSDGTIIDPTNLKAGQRIAVTFEEGGFDIVNTTQLLGNYDSEYITPGYYTRAPGARGDGWSNSTGSSPWKTSNALYASQGDAVSYAGANTTANQYTLVVNGAAFANGERLCSNYIGMNNEERGFDAGYGLVMGTLFFEVQKDCNLKDVLTLSERPDGCTMEPISRDVYNDNRYLCSIGDYEGTFANIAVVWTNPNGGDTECEHEWALTETLTAATCSAEGEGTYTCTKCAEQKTDVIAIDADAHVYTNFVSNNDATCLADGTKTAACDLNADHAKKTVADEGSKLDHSYTGALTALENNQHTVACVNGCTTTETVDCTFTVVDHKDATVTEEGYDKYECACGNGYTVTLDKITCEHVFTNYVSDNNATCTADGTKTATCDVCGNATDTIADEGSMKPHTFTEYKYNNDATCAADGTETATCDVCGVATDDRTAEGTKTDVHTFTKYEYNNDATCAADGTETATCDVCGVATDDRTAEGTKTDAHTFTNYVSDNNATCTADGTKTATCDVCGNATDTIADEGSMKAHTFTKYVYNNDATVDADGTETAICDTCGVQEDTRPAAGTMLASYNITVAATDFGKVTLNGVDVTDGATVKVAAQTEVKLVAEANDGSKFLGWVANGLTTVSTDATFTTVALADVTYAPVFEKADDTTFTVVFADGYGNIISSQAVTDAADVVIPDAPARSGYVFAGWTMTEDEIHALTSSATVVAMYELDESANYTVTATGATITGDGIDATDVAENVPYDTLVTVTKEGAKGWSVNGVTVAYGDTYSFYVGKDIEVVAVMEGVDAVPMVANVGTKEVAADGKIKVQFIATRTMADGYTYIDSGFVYGKGDLGDITLDDVDGKAVKAAYTKTASEQFSVSYGLAAQSGTMTARAFIAWADADGKVEVTYATPMTYTYA